MYIILSLCFWYVSGVCSFIYWFTKEYNFTMEEVLLCLFVGFMGPFAFLMGYSIHGKSSTILIKRRK